MATSNLVVKVIADERRFRFAVRRSLIDMGVPLHRADVPVDSCGICDGHPCTAPNGGKHRAVSA